jgi:hypothetical protein
MVPWEANEWIGKLDPARMSENEQQTAQQTAAYAMGRRFDRIILGTLDAEAGNIATWGDGTTLLTPGDILGVQSDLFAQGIVGMPEITVVLPHRWLTQLEAYREFSSSEYVGDEFPMLKALGARRYRGMTFIPVPVGNANAKLNYLNIPSAGQHDGYIYFKSCVGFATSMQLESRVDYVPTKKAWLAANTMMATAKTILTTGVRRLRFQTPAAGTPITRPTP